MLLRFPIAFDVGLPFQRRRGVWLVRGGGRGGASHAFDGFVCASIGCVCRIAWAWGRGWGRVACGRGGLRACAAACPVQPARRASHSVGSGSGSGRRRGWLGVEPAAGWCRTSLSHDAGAGSIFEQGGSEAAAAAAARRRCRLVCVCGCAARAAVRPGPRTEPETARDNLKQRTYYTTGNTISTGRIYGCTRTQNNTGNYNKIKTQSDTRENECTRM